MDHLSRRVHAGVGAASRLQAQGVEPRALSPEAFAKLVADDYATMAKVVKTVGKVQ